MTMTYKVTKNFLKKAPEVIHVDKTTRPQIINQKINPRFYKIINQYFNLSGIPLVI